MLITYNKLVELVGRGVVENVEPEQINGASIDVRLGTTLLVEDPNGGKRVRLDDRKDPLPLMRLPLTSEGYWELHPGAFALASTMERFNLPDDIAFEFKLRSNIARRACNHLLAGWADPGFNNAELTLELKNASQYSMLLLKPGLSIGQLVFWVGEPVPLSRSYRTVGSFNGQQGPTKVAV
ncbi:MAG: hypothetical protein VBE63_08270 [Lamprobacter sp.]|uniref:dCTP deaminase n=1 Tax=Lamprobacter sp. TaxID=3100796 RepID=UPI002B256CC6|nr:hypothetical protein [Lamprobacter sp.]MEA3639924.1 hypothetical protein [Lamprobacter sp.]